jgi:hypothetical protein
MSNAIAQLTDAQLVTAGWTNGQVTEVRKYLKTPGYQRNAHQRALCRRYSEAQRQIFAVKPDARFTNGKKAKATRERNKPQRWVAEKIDFVIDQYDHLVDTTQGVENRALYVANVLEAYPDTNPRSIPMMVGQIKKFDQAGHQEGLNGSALLRERLAAYNERVGYTRFAV